MRYLIPRIGVLLSASFIVLIQLAGTAPRSQENPQSVIVQAEDLQAAHNAVRAGGGEVLWNDGLTETMSINVWVDQQ